jgi:predicted glycosyltransferase involved in capsule biosynthesis
MTKSLEVSQGFINSISDIELDNMMKEFDNYEIEKDFFWFDKGKFHDYLSHEYKNQELFKIFDKQERKSIVLKENKKKDLNKVLFYYPIL